MSIIKPSSALRSVPPARACPYRARVRPTALTGAPAPPSVRPAGGPRTPSDGEHRAAGGLACTFTPAAWALGTRREPAQPGLPSNRFSLLGALGPDGGHTQEWLREHHVRWRKAEPAETWWERESTSFQKGSWGPLSGRGPGLAGGLAGCWAPDVKSWQVGVRAWERGAPEGWGGGTLSAFRARGESGLNKNRRTWVLTGEQNLQGPGAGGKDRGGDVWPRGWCGFPFPF